MQFAQKRFGGVLPPGWTDIGATPNRHAALVRPPLLAHPNFVVIRPGDPDCFRLRLIVADPLPDNRRALPMRITVG